MMATVATVATVASIRLVYLRASESSPCSNIYSMITRYRALVESLVNSQVSHEYVYDGRPIHPIDGRLKLMTPAVSRSRSSDTYGLVEVHWYLGSVSFCWGWRLVQDNFTCSQAAAGSW